MFFKCLLLNIKHKKEKHFKLVILSPSKDHPSSKLIYSDWLNMIGELCIECDPVTHWMGHSIEVVKVLKIFKVTV